MAGTSFREQGSNQRLLGVASRNLGEVLAQIDVGAKDGLADVGVEVVNAIRRRLSTPGTGRLYRRRRIVHRASAPGQPPAVDTGRLRSSYTWKVGEDPQGAYVEVGTSVRYAPWLEFGTRRMRPRPHVRPAINDIRDQIGAIVAQAIAARQRAAVGRLPHEVRG